MDTRTTKGLIIRGAFAMAPVSHILFKDLYIDEFRGRWDDLVPKVKEQWARLAELLEAAINSTLWKQTDGTPETKTDIPQEVLTRLRKHYGDTPEGLINLQAAMREMIPNWPKPSNILERYQRCVSQLLNLFPSDPLGDSPAHYYIERLEALIEKQLLTPVVEDRISTIPNECSCHTHSTDTGEDSNEHMAIDHTKP